LFIGAVLPSPACSALALIKTQVKQVVMAIHAKVFPLTLTKYTLSTVIHAPIHGAIEGLFRITQDGQQ
jgi:hypothetical protein